ncbi:hypothetical protein BHU72_04105 [Desulfuribacillus stibiiarsenatis]|uniref:Guanylate cyclase domain-containing protein n=1 Tax=Desulfuribacillus stibiiarsenatis TaxID=1390249 RepID=A0A1E5L567_9FIRM|nr:adenylate/guanylate cyclase domain-containing protein [Desulfuribacillus stibiiarsenatis]OEH85287.1 hypothetical protein BHU72_04105 [Desulfuribacillus stibiiarsenatis]
MTRLKKWSYIIHSALLVLFIGFFLAHTFEIQDYRLQDSLYQKPAPTDPRIVIIAIEDESLEVLGRWPWPRDYHGELLRVLSEGNPAVVGFDLIFAEPSLNPADDEYFLSQVKEAGNVVLPAYGSFDQSSKRGMLQAKQLSLPFRELKEASTIGHINTVLDNDGLVRRTVLQFNYEGDIVDSFAWQIYQMYASKFEKTPLQIDNIPLDYWSRPIIKYYGEPMSIESIPYHLVLTGEIPAEYFRDKIVLVGTYTVGIDDYYFTPIAPQVPMFGIEIHSNIIQQFLHQEFYQDVPLTFQVIIMILLGLLGFIIFYRFRPGISAIALIMIFAGYIFGCIVAYKNGFVMSIIYQTLFITSQYVVALGHQFIAEQLEKKRITDVFGKYVAPQIVGKILAEGEDGLKLGGIRREISCLFVDIRGFTPLSEAAQPEEVVSILNEYLTLCAQSIFDYDGTLDKFIGDATMAIFNAPFDVKQHQLRAVQAAWAMYEGSKPLQEDLQKRFGRSVRFGIGIHTGPAVIGNIGAHFRMDYTAIGDTVNTAARLESNSKPGQILISDAIYQYVKEHVEVTDLGVFQVKGKTQGIQVYQVDHVRNMDKPSS